MALSNRVSQKKVKRKAPRGFLQRLFKQRKPHLRLEARGDLLVHLNCLLFVHRLAEESRTNACENKCGVINKDHVLAAAKAEWTVRETERKVFLFAAGSPSNGRCTTLIRRQEPVFAVS